MSLSLAQFTEALSRSGLLSPPEVGAFVDSIPENDRPQDGPALAERLRQASKLTPYQAEVLLKGEVKGLVYGDYTVLERIGAGGMGQVFKAIHRRMKRTVAIKTLPPSTVESEKALKRFYREVEAAAKLAHPNIVTAYDAGEWQGVHYLVMEYVDGRDLARVLKDRGPLPVSEAVGAVVQAAAGLEHAHAQGVYHRDIKLANLLVDKAGVVKVLDMGIARVETLTGTDASEDGASDGLTNTNQMLGTVEYVAPEQARNAKEADHRSDIYSLGCCLYKLLAGKPPYTGDSAFMTIMAHMKDPIPSLSAVNSDAPPKLEEVFQRMLAKKPADRYQSVTEVIGALLGCGISVRLPAATSAGAMLLRAAEGSSEALRSPESPTTSRAKPDQGTPLADSARVAAVSAVPPASAVAATPAGLAPAAPATHPAPAATLSAAPPVPQRLAALAQKTGARAAAGWNWTQGQARAGWDFARHWRTRRPHWAARVDSAQARAAAAWQRSRAVWGARKNAWLAAHPTWTEQRLNLTLAAGCVGLALMLTLPMLFLGRDPHVAEAADVGSQTSSASATDSGGEASPAPTGDLAWMDRVAAELSTRPAPAPVLAQVSEGLCPTPVAADRGQLELADAGLDAAMRDGAGRLLPAFRFDEAPAERRQPERDFAGPRGLAFVHRLPPAPEVAGRPVDESLDLLRLIDLRRDTVFGAWTIAQGELSVQQPPAPIGRPQEARCLSVLLRYTPPPEFDLVIQGSRRSGNGPLLISMPVEMQGVGKLPTLAFGLEPRRNDGFENELPAVPPIPIRNATPVRILLKIRPAGMAAEINGVRVDASTLLDAPLDAAFRHPDDVVFRLGSFASAWRITDFAMLPPSETGSESRDPKAEPPKNLKGNIRAVGESQLQPGSQLPQPQPPRSGPQFRELAPDSGQIPLDPIRNLVPDFGPGKGFGKGFGKGKGK